MKLALLSMDYPPRMAGGTTIHTYQLAKALDSLGHEVHVVAASHPEAPSEEVAEGIHIHRVKRPYSVFSAFRTRKLLKDLDIIHGHGICSYGHLILNKFPTVVKMHNTWLGEYERYKKMVGNIVRKMDSTTTMKLYIRMDKTCCKKADHIICISDVMRRDTKKYGIDDKKMTIIHNGIDFAKFDIKENFRDKLGLDGTVVGYIGRLEPHKGVEYLIKAAKNMNKNCKFLLVGGGSDENRLRGLVNKLGLQKKIKFTGYVPYDDIAKYYASVDVVVYPTLYEPLGNVILESMAASKPIVASAVDGIPEIFEDGTGYLIKTSAKAIEEKLEILVDDDKLRKKMGALGKTKVKDHSWIEVAKQTVEVCEGVLGK
jgi:glycosyltransferase involved in cell wall biosynthesis